MKLVKAFETETYTSEGGYYAIKQCGWPDEDQFILLTPNQMRHVVKEMQELLADTSWHQEAVFEE